MTSPLGCPLMKIAAPLEILCFLSGNWIDGDGEDCLDEEAESGVSRRRSNEGGDGLRSDATGTMMPI